MKAITIKRTRSDLPGMILIAGLFLFPGLYMMYESRITSTAFILAAIFTLLIATIASFVFVLIFKYHGFFMLTKDGLVFQQNDGKKVSEKKLCKWEDISSYRLVTETERYYSAELNGYQEKDACSIVLTLHDGSSLRIAADKLSREPEEIIALFDWYRRGRGMVSG